jgi:hypothetical protein
VAEEETFDGVPFVGDRLGVVFGALFLVTLDGVTFLVSLRRKK